MLSRVKTSGAAVVAWRDDKVVTLASNSVGVEPVGSTSRWSPEKRQRISSKFTAAALWVVLTEQIRICRHIATP